MIRILLVDDHPVLRSGLKALLAEQRGIEVVGEAGDGVEALEQAERLRPDVVLMDSAMPEMGGAEAARRVTTAFPRTAVVGLTQYDDPATVLGLLRSGAIGVVIKTSGISEVVAAIKAASAGRRYVDPKASGFLVDGFLSKLKSYEEELLDELTPREREVLGLLAEGYSQGDIAVKLDITPRTVETHRRGLTEKLGITHTAGLTKFALKLGLTSPENVGGNGNGSKGGSDSGVE
jgi:two-component system, NarL family, response regulator NreC